MISLQREQDKPGSRAEGPKPEGASREGCRYIDPTEQVCAMGRGTGRGSVCEGHRKEATPAQGTHSFQLFQEKEVRLGDSSQCTIFILKTQDYKPNPINQSNPAHGLPDVSCGFGPVVSWKPQKGPAKPGRELEKVGWPVMGGNVLRESKAWAGRPERPPVTTGSGWEEPTCPVNPQWHRHPSGTHTGSERGAGQGPRPGQSPTHGASWL